LANSASTTVGQDIRHDAPLAESIPADTLRADSTIQVPPSDANEKTRKPERRKFRKVRTYFAFQPTLAYQKVQPVKADGTMITSLQPQGILSAQRLGWELAAGLQHTISPRLDIYGGGSYLRSRQTLAYNYQIAGDGAAQRQANGQYLVVPQEHQQADQYTARYWTVHAGILYTLKATRLRQQAGLGLQYQRGTLTRTIQETTHPQTSAHLSYQLMYRFEYQVSQRLSAYAEPSFTHAVGSRDRIADGFSVTPYRAGLRIGILWYW